MSPESGINSLVSSAIVYLQAVSPNCISPRRSSLETGWKDVDTPQPGSAPQGVSAPLLCSSGFTLTPTKNLAHDVIYTYIFVHTIEFHEGRNGVSFSMASSVLFRAQFRCHFFQEAIPDFTLRWFRCLHWESFHHRFYCPIFCLYLYRSPLAVWELFESVPY